MAKSTKICDLGKRAAYETPIGIKIGSNGKSHHPRALPRHATKGEMRRIRRALHRAGKTDLLNQTLGR